MSKNTPKTNLSIIFHYGREALSNRRKDLFLIALMLILGPDLVLFFFWQSSAERTVAMLQSFSSYSPLAQIEALAAQFSSMMVGPLIGMTFIKVLGVLTLARSCVDYFESQPRPVKSANLRALKVLFTKGLGVIAFLLVISPLILAFPFFRALTISLLVMLPVTLVASTHGGFRTAFDTVFLRYARYSPVGRWPVFFNVLSVTGIFLAISFGLSFFIDQLAILDVIYELPAGFLDKTIDAGGVQMNSGLFMSRILSMLWDSLSTVLIIPFTAAIYHLTTAPDDHVSVSISV